jgi:hypothetical protein
MMPGWGNIHCLLLLQRKKKIPTGPGEDDFFVVTMEVGRTSKQDFLISISCNCKIAHHYVDHKLTRPWRKHEADDNSNMLPVGHILLL